MVKVKSDITHLAECNSCGEELVTTGIEVTEHTDPWGGHHGYFCNEDCRDNAGEAYDQRKLEDTWG